MSKPPVQNFMVALSVLLIQVTVFFCSPAHAQEAKLLGVFHDWTAWQSMEQGNPVCYMLSKPVKSEGKYKIRGDVYAQITHRPAEKSFDVVSFVSGYTYGAESVVKIMVDNRPFQLIPNGDTAWTPDAATDSALTKAIRAGNQLVIEGTSSRGTLTRDSFSLKGTTAAINALNKACKWQASTP